MPSVRLGLRRPRPGGGRRRSSHEVDETIGIDRLRALHINDSATPLGSNRDRHANILEGEIGEGMGAFLAHPAFQELSAYLEVEGTGDGVNKDELAKVRGIHERWTVT